MRKHQHLSNENVKKPQLKTERKKLVDEKSGLQCCLSSLRALLASAQELISKGVLAKDKVESGNLLLSDTNSTLPSVLDHIRTTDSVLQVRKKY